MLALSRYNNADNLKKQLQMILFTGLTGKVGDAIVRLLPEFGVQARGLVRDPGKAAALEAAGVEVAVGDLDDAAAIRAALEGCEKAFLLMANGPRQLELELGFIEAARGAGLAHLVKMSANGADSASAAVLKRFHGDAEESLRASGLPYTVIRPNFFMQNLLWMAAEIAARDSFSMPMGKGRVGIIDVRDVARFVLTALTQPGHENKTYEITGPELVSFHDIARQLSAATGRTIRYIDIAPEAFRRALAQWMPDDWQVEAVAQLFALIAQGQGALINDVYRQATGREPGALRQFFSDCAPAFAPRREGG